MDGAFGLLFGTHSKTEFLRDTYERTFLHLEGRPPNVFAALFSLTAAEQVLWEQEAHLNDFVRYHNHGRDVVPPSHVAQLDILRWIVKEYAAGTTLIMNGLEDRHLPIAKCVRDLEIGFGFPVSAAAYLTPTGARAFGIHFDTHDVVIAQVEGSKTYDLYEHTSVPRLPLRRQQAEVNAIEDLVPVATVELKPGETLYMPRGLIHVAKTSDQHSLHITFSLHPPKIADFGSTVVELAAELNPELRTSAPSSKDDAHLVDLLSALNRVLNVSLTVEDVLLRQRRRFVAGLRKLPSKRMLDQPLLINLQLDDFVEKAPGAVSVSHINDDELRLGVSGLERMKDTSRNPASLGMPAALVPAIAFIEASVGQFQIKDLPGAISEGSKVVMAKHLIREGLLQISTFKS